MVSIALMACNDNMDSEKFYNIVHYSCKHLLFCNYHIYHLLLGLNIQNISFCFKLLLLKYALPHGIIG